MSGYNVGLGPFLRRLDDALADKSADDLRAVLLGQAERLPAPERGAFLAIFEQPGAPAEGPANIPDEHLAQDVDKFAADVADEIYYRAWEYDHEYGDERAWGDESWAIEFDGLAERAASAFLRGDVTLARTAYHRLLKVLSDDEGHLPAAGPTDEVVQTDLAEAKHRYLRAVWEDEPPAARAGALLAADSEVEFAGPVFTLEGLDAARRERLPDETTVLPDLIELLKSDPGDKLQRLRTRRLLTQAVERLHGADGLAGLARTPGDDQPEAYRDWVDALARDGRLDDARDAASEALATLDHGGHTVASIAKRRAMLAAADGDASAVLYARLVGWRADPALPGLLELADVAATLDRMDEVMTEEASRAHRPPLSDHPSLAAATLILGGRTDDAAALLKVDKGRDESFRPGADQVALPVLLIGASDAMEHLDWPASALATLLDGADNARSAWSFDPSDDVPEAIAEAIPDAVREDFFRMYGTDTELTLANLLADELSRRPPSHTQRTAWLSTALDQVAKRISSIVNGKHRGLYPHAATLVAACAEALLLTSETRTAHEYVAGVRSRYPRHVAFKRDLDKAISGSPLLS